MKIWLDTEFVEDGRTIDLISIGMMREDNKGLYMQNVECDLTRASPWVKDNVIPHLTKSAHLPYVANRREIAAQIRLFAGEKPEFWAYYADYDWVVLCQLYGTMMDLPEGWPMFCRDVKQFCVDLGDPKLPEAKNVEHHAYADACWTREAYEFLTQLKAKQ